MRFITLQVDVDGSLAELSDCRSKAFKITNIVLDLESIPPNANGNDWWSVWVFQMNPDGGYHDALLANLSRTVSQVQIDLTFSSQDNVKFYLKSAKSGVVYLNGYEVKGK